MSGQDLDLELCRRNIEIIRECAARFPASLARVYSGTVELQEAVQRLRCRQRVVTEVIGDLADAVTR